MNFKYLMMLIAIVFVIASCKNDDDNGLNLLPQDEQNDVDDEAIVLYLKEHYFNSVGKVMKFDDDDESDDNETPLYDIAEMDAEGYWYAKRPGFVAEGRAVTNHDNDSILLQYEMKIFNAGLRSDTVYYSTAGYASTINGTGLPQWDPDFYYKTLTDTQIENNYQREWNEMEGVISGLQHFNSTNKAATDQPSVDFQGVIVVPSRLVFKRDKNALRFAADTSVILNFELYQVIDRE